MVMAANALEEVVLSTRLEPGATTVVLNLWVISPGNKMALSEGCLRPLKTKIFTIHNSSKL